MIVKDNLQVVLALQDSTGSVVANLCLWVDIDDLTVSLVLEEQPGVLVGYHVVVRRASRLGRLSFAKMG